MNQNKQTATNVRFETSVHKETPVIKIIFEYNKELIERVKALPQAAWSQRMKSWYVPDTDAYRKRFNLNLKQAKDWTTDRLCEPNTKALDELILLLRLKGYSESTITTYRNEFTQLLLTLQNVPVHSLSHQRLQHYFAWCHTVKKLSENTIHSRLNAVKFYFEQVLKGEKFFWDIPRPKKRLQLPKVLGKEELRRLFQALANTKHKAILFAAYSAGLRVSEVVNLQLKHIDRSRMQLLIENSKGKKDRYVSLSPMLLDILENYYKGCQP